MPARDVYALEEQIGKLEAAETIMLSRAFTIALGGDRAAEIIRELLARLGPIRAQKPKTAAEHRAAVEASGFLFVEAPAPAKANADG